MGDIVDLNDVLIYRKATRILDLLEKDYDKKELKKRVDICKEIVLLFGDDLEYLESNKKINKNNK